MKFFMSVACSLFLLGCSDSSTQTPSAAPSDTPVAVSTQTVAQAPIETIQEVQKVVDEPAKAVEPVIAAGVDGSALYGQKCASCHGAKAEKAALGKSQVIANLDESQIKEALKGYKVGTYGREMKAVMQGQAKGLNDAQIDALAKTISAL
jgi:cytochrome c553